jgi:hypothetical protein
LRFLWIILVAKTPMKKLYLLPILSVSLVSCFTYQYMTVNSTDTVKNKQNEFVVENDSFRLVYNFRGLDVPINIRVENKLQQPITIDWRQSALIVNDRAISYVATTVPITGYYNGSSFQWNPGYGAAIGSTPGTSNYTSSGGNVSATAVLPSQMDFIPPKAYITKNPMGVTNRFYTIPEGDFHKESVLLFDGTTRKVNMATYTKDNSPLQFKSYITVLLGDVNAPDKKVTYEHSFYIEEFIRAGMAPEYFQFTNNQEGNRAYVRETSGFANVGWGIVAGAAIITSAALSSQQGYYHPAK